MVKMKPIKKAKETMKLPSIGTKVRIKAKIAPKEECGGFLVNEKYIQARKPKTNGVYVGYVSGAGGDLWWIKHDDDSEIGCYDNTEVIDR